MNVPLCPRAPLSKKGAMYNIMYISVSEYISYIYIRPSTHGPLCVETAGTCIHPSPQQLLPRADTGREIQCD